MTSVSKKFLEIASHNKASLLARIIHMETVYIRSSYHKEVPDLLSIFESSELIHRLSGYIMRLLDGDSSSAQDISVIDMITMDAERRGGKRMENLNSWIEEYADH